MQICMSCILHLWGLSTVRSINANEDETENENEIQRGQSVERMKKR